MKKKLFKEVDELGLEVWDADGTLGDFINSLDSDQTDFFMNLLLRDFVSDSNEMSFGIELVAP